MKKLVTLAAMTCLYFSSANAGPLVFPESGFSINSLESQQNVQGSTPLQMLLPPTNGFSANVNVQLQPYAGSIAEYKTVTEQQFSAIGLTLVSIEEGKNSESLSIEYKGLLQGQSLHWCAKAFKKGNIMYVVTATDTEASWEKHKEQLIANVQSFKLL
jgi:hypothetical protein